MCLHTQIGVAADQNVRSGTLKGKALIMSVSSPAAAAILSVVTGIGLFAGRSVAAAPSHAHGADLPLVDTHDNRQSAGKRIGGTLRIALRAGRGRWQPQGDHAPSWEVEAFGEVGGPLQVPAPSSACRRAPRSSPRTQRPRQAAASPRTLRAWRFTLPSACRAAARGAGRPIRQPGPPARTTTGPRPRGMPLAFRASRTPSSQERSIVDPAAAGGRRPRDGHHRVDQPDPRADAGHGGRPTQASRFSS